MFREKALVSCAPDTEMKSGTVIKSRRRSQICDVLSEMDGMLFQLTILKKYLEDEPAEEKKKKRALTTTAHGFTISMAASFNIHYNRSLRIVIDNMKAAEVLGTRNFLEQSIYNIDYQIVFADSKDKNHRLLQAVDHFAGLTNKAIADYESTQRSENWCIPCAIRNRMCGDPHHVQTDLFYDIQRYANLFAVWSNKDKDKVIGNGLRIFPEIWQERYRFFDCVMHVPPRKEKE